MSGPGYESGMFKPGDKAKDGSTFLGETEDGSPLWAEPVPPRHQLDRIEAALERTRALDGPVAAQVAADLGWLVGVARAAEAVTQYDLSAMPHDYHGYRLIPRADAERFADDLAALAAALAAATSQEPA